MVAGVVGIASRWSFSWNEVRETSARSHGRESEQVLKKKFYDILGAVKVDVRRSLWSFDTENEL